MFRKVVLEPYKSELRMSNGDDIEVVHWVNINEQLKGMASQMKEIAGDLSLLRRQVDKTQSERDNLDYRLTQLEKKPEQDRSKYTLYTLFGGCLYMVVSVLVELTIAGLTIYLAHQ